MELKFLRQTKVLMCGAAGNELSGWDALENAAQLRRFSKAQEIFGSGEWQPYIYVIRRGIVKLSYLDDTGEEWVKSFIGEGGFFACPSVIISGGKTDYFAVALEDVELEQLHYPALQNLAEKNSDWSRAVRVLLESHILRKEQRERELLTMTPDLRYHSFLQSHRTIVKRIQIRDIAKYLGITPEALSRIRTRMRNKKHQNSSELIS
ncbi:Crp/Fnr family transcriptional regulator [Undibacterium luofuense]|uniref:Crp/Fnr family transcriptional regulator n=1 Tax=Undibacterium luofuense TaxID=2828733 RepID=UPI0030EC1366